MNNENLEILRHSAAHVMASAVKELFKDVKIAIGPAIEDGFYYDFDYEKNFVPEDLEKIELKMKEIIARNSTFIKKEISKKDAISIFKNEPYKLEILNDIQEDKVTLYQNGDFVDLCRGPHLNSTGEIKAFKLLSIAGAYWRGDEKNRMLQRIYGTAFSTEEKLKEHLFKLEEAKKRDHRKLGKELDLFSIHEKIGGGLIHWHPKGAIIKRIIENIWCDEHLKNGYEIVSTPHIASEEIYKTSGHLENYSDLMYSPMDIEGRPFRVKPMNCPGHIMIYKTRIHSYREFPIRLAELGAVYRYEKSGVLHGLLRVRGFTIDDAHIFCRPDQMENEVINVFRFAVSLLKIFGFNEIEIYIATKPEKAIGSSEDWEKATNALKQAVSKMNLQYHLDEGGGAFYGPKIDLKVKDTLGKLWQCTTIQFDFNLPARFDVNYVGEDGKSQKPYMIHRALLGSLERFIGVLIEHYGGAFPMWLSPVQIELMTITDAEIEYAREVAGKLKQNNIRVRINDANEKIGYKIREAQLQKVPYMLIIGKKEAEAKLVSVRKRGKGDIGPMSLDDFLKLIEPEFSIPKA